MDVFICTRFRLCKYLMDRGFIPYASKPDKFNPQYRVYLFEETPALNKAVSRIFMLIAGRQKNATIKEGLKVSSKKKVRFYHTNPDNAGQPMGPFDRTILFSCFSPWVESIRQQRQTDPEKAVDAFLALADYCLYAKEPDPATNPWGWRGLRLSMTQTQA